MASYSWVSVTALFGYLFLLLAFMVAKKTKVIRSFMYLLECMILAAGGSFLMRIRFWPSVNFWHYVSLLGIVMVPSIFFRFFLDFLEEKRGHGRLFWVLFFCGAYVINLFTQCFIPTPEVRTDALGNVSFVYHYGWSILILLTGAVCIVVQCTMLFVRYCKGDALILRQLRPVLLGLGIMVAGTALSTLKPLAGIPIDIISSVIFAYLVFYALYRKRLLKLALLASPANCYIVAVLISMAVFYKLVMPLQRYLVHFVHLSQELATLLVAFMLVGVIFALYLVMKRFLDALFVKDEQSQAETIQQFSRTVSKTLNKNEILTDMLEVIQRMIPVDMAYVCLKEKNGDYTVAQTLSALHNDNFVLKADHPLIAYLTTHDGGVLMEDFVCTREFRSMWEQEKQQLKEKEITCVVPMKDGDDLIGLVLLPQKRKGKPYTFDDFSLLSSVCSVCSMAVKNSRLYEKAYSEARRDELTGLYNRKSFYESVNKLFEQRQERSLALVMLNVDDFKLYNQLYGNKEGDAALRRIADIIRITSEGRGTAFRMAGKEFALLLPGYDIYSAKLLVESVLQQVRNMHESKELYQLKTLTMSCGICAAPYMASTVEELIANTDFAVYTAKRGGKNQVVIYSEEAKIQSQEAKRTGGYDAYASTIVALTAAIDTKDHYTFRHSQNVANYASQLAKGYGMNQEFVDIVREAGLLHDIGKIGIREDILNKPGKLDDEEYAIMKTHVENSVGIIRHLPSLDYVIPAVISHHERYDGRGYPRGLAGENIPLMGRMLCVADSFDAMVSKRSYKNAMSIDKALEIIERERGRQFDPVLADLFVKLVRTNEIEVKN